MQIRSIRQAGAMVTHLTSFLCDCTLVKFRFLPHKKKIAPVIVTKALTICKNWPSASNRSKLERVSCRFAKKKRLSLVHPALRTNLSLNYRSDFLDPPFGIVTADL